MKAVLSGDIGGTHIRLALVDREGNIHRLVKDSIEPSARKDPSCFINQLVRMAGGLMTNAAGEGLSVAGIGLGVAGKISKDEGVILFSPNLPQLNNVPIAMEIKKKTGLTVFLENDANVFGMGEAWKGCGKGINNWLGVTLGTGVGGCLFLNGRLWTGDEGAGFVGEIGHTTIFPEGVLCKCGKKGCLEAYASEGGLVRLVEKNISEEWRNSSIKPLFREEYIINRSSINARLLFDLASKGDPYALNLFSVLGMSLGIAVSNVFTVLGIRTAIIGGGVSQGWSMFFPFFLESLGNNCSMMDVKVMEIYRSELGDKAALLGAALHAFEGLG